MRPVAGERRYRRKWEEFKIGKTYQFSTALSALVAGAISTAALAEGTDLTLCWAAWEPTNASVDLSKDFATKSGHTKNFEFAPWPNCADRMLNDLNSGGQLYDLEGFVNSDGAVADLEFYKELYDNATPPWSETFGQSSTNHRSDCSPMWLPYLPPQIRPAFR